MPLPAVNGYNSTFTAFVKFAQDSINAGNKKAIANVAQTPLGNRKIVASKTDSVGGIFTRARWEEGANNATRDIFLKAVARMFGGKSKIPESVWSAIKLEDYGHGQPLTARRIMAVKKAVDAHLSAPPDKLDVTVLGRTVTFDKWHYEGLVAAMPEAQRGAAETGHLWENYFIAEHRKRILADTPETRLFFWRTSQRQEVDLVEESADGLSACELKWNPGKTRNPICATFRNAYPEAVCSMITPDNFAERLL